MVGGQLPHTSSISRNPAQLHTENMKPAVSKHSCETCIGCRIWRGRKGWLSTRVACPKTSLKTVLMHR
jgi:hypothetical protein